MKSFRPFVPLASIALAGVAAAQDLVLTTKSNRLVRIDVGAPGTVQWSAPITGLQAGEDVLGVDFRPFNNELYALGSTSRIYRIDVDTGAATPVGSPLVPALNGTAFGFDFNPTVDRIRIVSNADQNLRVHPDTGAVAAVDGTLQFAPADAFSHVNPNCVAAAYTNNVNGATTTTLYDIDSNLDVLVTQSPPNAGTLNTVGPLGVNAGEVVDFDVAGTTKVAYAVITSPGSGVTSSALFLVDLMTGAASFLSTIGVNEVITGMSVVPTPGAVQYGRATPGCFGNPAIGASGSPVLGTLGFFIKCVNAHPGTFGRLILGLQDLQAPAIVFGAEIYVDPLFAGTFWFPVFSDAMGSNTFPIPIPGDQGLDGMRLFLQYVWADRCSRGGLAASNALALTLRR
jgi:hypothetical protein